MPQRRLNKLWWGCGLICLWSAAVAHAQSPESRSLRMGQWADSHSTAFDFGVMGRIARPGVYRLRESHPQIVDVIQQAGGLTQAATNQIRIVRQGSAGQIAFYSPNLDFRLSPGDVIVADGPIPSRTKTRDSRRTFPGMIRTAGFEIHSTPTAGEDYRQVALMDVLDRPVILPVPAAHANVRSIIAYLGQDSRLNSHVRVLPVGRLQSSKDGEELLVPTVLYFPKGSIDADRLPDLPDVYDSTNEPAIPLQTAERLPPVPMPLDPDSQGAHSVVEFPAATELPLIAEVRRMEDSLPTPESLSPEPVDENIADLAVPIATNKAESPQGGMWWALLGVVVLSAVGLVIHAKLRVKTELELPLEKHIPIVEAAPVAPAFAEQPKEEPQPDWMRDETLAALVLNQLPIAEHTQETVAPPAPTSAPVPEDKPISRKFFRIDPPEESHRPAAKGPNYLKDRKQKPSPKSEPSPTETIASGSDRKVPMEPATKTEATEIQVPRKMTVEIPKDQPTPRSRGDLLSRVLQQVNRSDAA